MKTNHLLFGLMFILSVSLLACGNDPKNQETAEVVKQHRVNISGQTCTFEEQIMFVVLALQVYRMHIGHFPSPENNLEALIAEPDILEGTGTWRGHYVESEKVFIDPWGRRLSYSLDEDGVIDLRSLGPDGVRSEDDLTAKEILPDVYNELNKLDHLGPIPIPPKSATSP